MRFEKVVVVFEFFFGEDGEQFRVEGCGVRERLDCGEGG